MTFVLHNARVASLIAPCLLLSWEDVTFYYWEWEKQSDYAGRPLVSAGVILDTGGRDSWVLLLLTFFCGLRWPLCLFLSAFSLLSLWILYVFFEAGMLFYYIFSTERPHSQQGYSGAFVLHVMISPYCKKGKINKQRQESVCVSDLKAGLYINICSTLGNKKCLAIAHFNFPFFFFPPLHPCIQQNAFSKPLFCYFDICNWS